jgi:hypothetical protein
MSGRKDRTQGRELEFCPAPRARRAFGWACAGILGITLGCDPGAASQPDVEAKTGALVTTGITATVAVYTQWADGYCANVNIKNTSTQTLTSWRVDLNVGAMTVTTNWNANVARSGSTLTMTNTTNNGTLAPQASTQAGLCAQGTPLVLPTVDQGTTTSLVWPNAQSSANSDPWLAQHHDEITEMHPKALIINFANGYTPAAVAARWDAMAKVMNEGTRYHGYADPNVKPFIYHELLKQVDLIDSPIPAGWTLPNSTKTPRVTTSDGTHIDYGQLYSQTFADYIGIKDPANPSRNLNLCELLQKGIMNELFLAIDNSEPNLAPEIIEYKQVYDSNDNALTGQFDPYSGNGAFSPEADLPQARNCGRSLRVDFLEMNNGTDGALHVLAHNYEHIGRAIPNVVRFYSALFNFDFSSRFQTRFNSWYDLSVNGAEGHFLSYPTNQSVAWTCTAGRDCGAPSGIISPFTQGCGNAHYPPNARGSYDYTNTDTVLTRCEHYGLHDGPNGKDLTSPYNVHTLDNLTAQYGNGINGGAWQLYLFQSIPGYGSHATTDDGVHIKNFWPYLYY